MNTLSQQFRKQQLDKELRSPFLVDEDDGSETNASSYDPYFNVTQAFKDASQKSLKSLRSSRESSSENVTLDVPTKLSSTIANAGGNRVDDAFSEEFTDQTGESCDYCSTIAKRVSHTRCYTSFYLLLFALGAVAAIVAVINLVNESRPKERGLEFFATYASLLLLFAVDIIIRFLASGCRFFCRRRANGVDLFMLLISIVALAMDIVPFQNIKLNQYIMLGDTCVVVLMTLLIFTRVVVLGCQHAQNIGELSGGAQDVILYNHASSSGGRLEASSKSENYTSYNYYASHRKHRKYRSVSGSSRSSDESISGQHDGASLSDDKSSGNRTRSSPPRKSTVKTSVVNLDVQATFKVGLQDANSKKMASYPPQSSLLVRASSGVRSTSFDTYHIQERSLLGAREPLRSFDDSASISSDRRVEETLFTSGNLPVLMEEEDSQEDSEEDVMSSVTTTHHGGALYSNDHLPEIRGCSFDYDDRKVSETGPLLGLLSSGITRS